MSRLSLLVILLFVGAAAALLAALPPDGFFSSDEGVKFIQLRSLAENGFRDARIRWPGDALGLERRYAVVERFFELRDGELYSPHPLLFALASAPGWLAFGFRGLYVLPLLAGAATVLLTVVLARAFGARRPWLAGAIVAFASPIFFYGLCYWEHTPAVALWLGGFVVLLRKSPARLAFAGALWGVGAALRPELYWLAAWSVAALFTFHKGERLRTAIWPAAAFLFTAVGLELFMQAAWGQPAFMRLGANLSHGGPRGAAAFFYAVGHSLVPLVPWYFGAAAAGAIFFAVAGIKWRPGAYVAAACGVPLTLLYWRFYGGYATPLVASFPALFGLAFLARAEVRRTFGAAAALEKSFYLAAGGFAATLFIVIPDTSGYAWGPRFLLYAVPAAATALVKSLEGAAERRPWPSTRATLITALVLLSAATQVFGLLRMGNAKVTRERLLTTLRSLEPGPVIVDHWYLPTYAAPLYGDRAFVLSRAEGQLPLLGDALRERGFRRAYFLTEIPTRGPEGDSYVLGVTSRLSRTFNVVDGRKIPGRGFTLPYYVWLLELGGPAEPGQGRPLRSRG